MGLFDISVSGLLTNQTSINTTSHNIANANVEGYSRQRASQEPRLPQFIGGNYLGTGVEVATIKRIFEATEQLELQATTSSFYSYDTYLDQAKRLDGLLADSDSGVNSAIQNFFTALQGVVNDPASIPARQVMISEGEMMISRFELVYNQLESQNNEINTNIYSIAEEISSLATSIANLNNQIAGSAGSPPPDLLDKRDLQITRLSELVSVQTIQQEDGNLNVFIGTGQALVIGSFSSAVEGRLDPADPRSMRLYLASGNSSIDVTQNIVGGELGGLLKVRDELLEPAFNTLGRIAIGIADNFNAQHQLGMDLNNQLGGNFFVDINDPAIQARRVISSTANAGSSVATLTIDDPNVLVDTNYQMYLSAGNFQLVDLRDNSVVASFAQPASPASVTMPTLGFTINFLSGAAVDGDSFKIQPTRNFSQDFTMAITTPEQIAAASPIRAEQLISNVGSGSVTGIQVFDTTTAAFTTVPDSLTPPIRIEFGAVAGEFSIYDMTTGTPVLMAGGLTGYVPNQDNDMLALAGAPFDTYGYEITLNGDPQAGDSFDISYNFNGVGNNANVSLLGELQFAKTLDNGNSNYQQAFGRIVSHIGVSTHSAEIKRDAAETLMFQAKERKMSTSGVNLDEEAANLIKFQQAYEASAQVIAVARTLFQTVLDSVR